MKIFVTHSRNIYVSRSQKTIYFKCVIKLLRIKTDKSPVVKNKIHTNCDRTDRILTTNLNHRVHSNMKI